MGSLGEIMQLCRLCLVKDKVNIPIFEGAGDIRKISHKISACLPVKVAKDDKLPKKICDGCSLKLDVIYQFWNTSTASEKQLLEWVNNPSSLKGESQDSRTNVAEHIVLKQEIDNGDSEALDAGEFIDVNDSFENIGYTHDDDDDMSNENIAIKTENDSQSYIEPPRKKQKVVSLSSAESEEDADDPSDAYNRDDSDEEDNDISDAQPTFVNVSDADQQPGPSGVGKSSGDAPKRKKRVHKTRRCNSDEEMFLYRSLRFKDNLICYICEDDKTMSKDELESHFAEKHVDAEVKWKVICPKEYHECEHCFKEFSSVVYLNTHIQTHEYKYTCATCKEGFWKLLDFIVHNQTHTDVKIFICVICQYQTDKKVSMLSHVNTHVKNRSIYKCSVCEKKFDEFNLLKDHQITHSDNTTPFICEICGSGYGSLIRLTEHRKSKHTEKLHKTRYPCEECKKTFANKKYVAIHMKNHRGLMLICDICGKQFKDPNYLKIHKNIHMGIKEFQCNACDKSFVTKLRLQVHVRTHTGERPYQCRHCEKSFNQTNSRKIHERLHTNERPFICHVCDNGFMSRTILNNHLKKCKGS